MTLFSDAAHHLNNPLNHIDGAKRSIRRQSHELESVVMELVNDDGVEEVQTYLKERFEKIRKADHVIENAVLRTARWSKRYAQFPVLMVSVMRGRALLKF